MSDQHRADAMGCASDLKVATPNLDELAAHGVRFGRAYCQGPLCMPARSSFLTGKYVREHGVFDNNRELPAEAPTFLHALRNEGYHNACFGKMHLYVQPGVTDVAQRADRMRGFGFDELHESGGKGASVRMRSDFTEDLERRGLFDAYRAHYRSHRGAPAWATIPFELPREVYPDTWLGNRVADWIDSYKRDEPFFAWVGFPGPHSPWDTPSPYVARYRDVDVGSGESAPPEEPHSEAYARFIGPRLRDSDHETLTPERIGAVRRAYFGNVTIIDEAVGAIVAALARRGMLENTLVIYTADHGEMLGEHGLLAKRVFYEPAVRVPLILRPPCGTGPSVQDGIVQHVDVTQAILAAAGAGGADSGARLLRGDATTDVAYSENLGFGAAITERWKLISHEESGEAVALFDLESDPLENQNVLGQPGARAALDDMLRGPMRSLLERPTVFREDARPEGRGGHED